MNGAQEGPFLFLQPWPLPRALILSGRAGGRTRRGGKSERGKSRGVWVSVSAECGHMTGGPGFMLDDSHLRASGWKAPPVGRLC